MIFVAAAGNFGENNENARNKILPASWNLDNIISVSAVGKDGEKTKFSNWGKSTVDISAPGDQILSPILGGGQS